MRMRASEYVVVVQKASQRTKGALSDHRILDAWTEQADR
jgi:hypothetical protein